MLNRVTLTGADDSIEPREIVDLSMQFPFAEWGILVSSSKQGGSRFPSLDWMVRLHEATRRADTQICLHVCGRWVREICQGNWTPLFTNLGPVTDLAQRVQLNFHAYTHMLTPVFITAALTRQKEQGWQVIFQCDGVNDCLVSNAYDDGLDAVPLYDKSGGAGVVPDEWPRAMAGIYSGYAGGIGPDNLCNCLHRIATCAGDQPFWIDMETKIRSRDDQQFDLEACRQVLEFCAPLVEKSQPSDITQ